MRRWATRFMPAFALVLGLLAVAHRDLLTTDPAATAASIRS